MTDPSDGTPTFPAPLDRLARNDRQVLSRFIETARYEAGERILQEGEPGDGCYIIDEGDVRIEVEQDHPDTENVLEVIGPGTFLGELSLLDGLPRSASAVADSAVTARRLSTVALEELESEHPRLGLALTRALGRGAALKLRQTNVRLAEHVFDEADDPEVDPMVARAVRAQEEFESWPEERVDALLGAMADAVAARAEELARKTVEDTRMGSVADKAFKNQVAARGIHQSLVGRVGRGPVGEEAQGVVEIASPAGVVFGMIPLTNPVATAVFKALIALKARNALVLSFHRRALGVGNEVGELLRSVLDEAGAPADLIQWVRNRSSRKKTRQFMSHPQVSLILATGGTGMVEAAYSSGTPALGVGPGNAPAWIRSDADLEAAARAVVESKSFDHGLICGAEHNLVVDARIRSDFVQALEEAGAAVLDPDETEAARKVLIHGRRNVFRPGTIGQDAGELAEKAGIERDHPIRVLVIPTGEATEENPLAGEKMAPVLSLFEVDGDEEAVALCRTLLDLEGTGHTATIHTRDDQVARAYAEAMPASRILVNSPGTQGVVGLTTGLTPSFTLGCGTFGGNSTTDNVSYTELVNVKRMAWNVPPERSGVGALA